MIVYVGCYSGDRDRALRVAELARQCSGNHDVRVVFRENSGEIPSLGVRVSTAGWPSSCTGMFKAFVASLEVGSVFLNLEPDAVLTRRTALDELQVESDGLAARWPSHCVLGHWKSPPYTPNAPVEHVSGSAVYRVTPELKKAVASVPGNRAWDLDLFFGRRLGFESASNTDLIRCFWGRTAWAPDLLRHFPRAALIHGDKSGVLLEHCESVVSQPV